MSIMNFIKEKKAKININRIKKIMSNFNVKETTNLSEVVKETSFDNLKFSENKCCDHNELTFNGEVIYKNEGNHVLTLNIDKIEEAKKHLTDNAPNRGNAIHIGHAKAALDYLVKNFIYVSVDGQKKEYRENGSTIIKNKIGDLEFFFEQKYDPTTESLEKQIQISNNRRPILNQKISCFEDKEKIDNVIFDSIKLVEAQEHLRETIDNALKEENKPRKKSMKNSM